MKRLFCFALSLCLAMAVFANNIQNIRFEGQLGAAIINTKTKTVFISFPYLYGRGIYPLKEAKLVKIETANNAATTLPTTVDLRNWTKFKVGNDEWQIKGGYQLPESNFKTWHSEEISGFITFGKVTCDDMVGSSAQTVWDNGNAAFSSSGSKNWPTKKIRLKDGSYAAELTTRSTMGVIASGSLFTGRVSRSSSLKQLLGSTDKSGTALIDWGVPFEARPIGIRVKIKYEGLTDSCSIMATLENRTGGARRFVGTAWYSATTDNSRKNEGIVSISEPDANGLRTLEMRFIFGRQPKNSDPLPDGIRQGGASKPITHATVVFTSSRRGDYFKGQKNARLIVRDFEFVY